MDNKLKLKMMENRRRVEEEYMRARARRRPDICRQIGTEPIRKKADPAADGDKFTESSKPGKKRKAPAPGPRRKVHDAPTFKPGTTFWNENGARIVFLFEFALGYALFDARGVDELPQNTTFEMAERYLNNNPFTLIAFYPFSSPADALVQMKAILNSTVTKELKSFLVNNLPKPIPGNLCYQLAVSDGLLAHNIINATKIAVVVGELISHVMRGLRVKIVKFIVGLKPQDLKKAQLNLARCYRRQSRACKASSMLQRIYHAVIAADKVVVVPHKFEGLFIAKGLGKKDFICTKNLVPGKVLHGDKLISVQETGRSSSTCLETEKSGVTNEDDRTEVEYRLWNPRISKLAAAILGGLTNIWVKPGSCVLYLGDVCGITVLQLSDLVGSDGLVYVRGLSDDVANTVEERSNVVTISGNDIYNDFRIVVGMVDVILGDIVYPEKDDGSLQVNYIAINARSYLRTGGHYLISTRPKNNNLTSQVKDPFVDHNILDSYIRMEFKSTELVMLEPIGRGHAMAVGDFRMVK
ncbi:hypothetical protein OROGR_033104 [Orobanche gracilis]